MGGGQNGRPMVSRPYLPVHPSCRNTRSVWSVPHSRTVQTWLLLMGNLQLQTRWFGVLLSFSYLLQVTPWEALSIVVLLQVPLCQRQLQCGMVLIDPSGWVPSLRDPLHPILLGSTLVIMGGILLVCLQTLKPFLHTVSWR